MSTQATFETFKACLRGEFLQRNDAGYEAARKVYNGMIDRHPRLIARCADVADMMAAVHYASDNDMLVAVRGGGHNGGGLGTCNDGLVIDLSPMKGIRVKGVSARRSTRARTRRDFPIPASPLSTTTWPMPCCTCAQRSSSRATSTSRPTKGVKPLGECTDIMGKNLQALAA